MSALLAWLHRDLPPAPLAGRVDAASVVIPCAGAALWLLERFHGRPGHFERYLRAAELQPGAWAPIAPHVGWYLSALLVLGLAPLAVLAALREPLGEYGLGLGRTGLGLKVAGLFGIVMVPAVLVAARQPAFAGHYPLAPGAATSWPLLAAYEAAYALYFVGWEAFWRGFLLRGLYRRIGLHAVYVLALPFAVAHQAKPEAEALGSIAAAIALGYLALRSRSFWWGALLHAGVAVAMDLACAWPRLAR